MGYVGLMEQFGSDEAFAMVYLPETISIILKQFNNSYEKLGNTKTVWQDPFQSSWTNPGFGAWFHQAFPQNSTNFTSVEMKGLYGVLGNRTLLLGETVTNMTVKEECKWDKIPVQRKCGFLLQMKAVDDLRKNNQNITLYSLMGLIGQTLCPNQTNQCFHRVELLGHIYFYMEHVNKYTMMVFLGEKFEIVATMSQKDLALGYTMGNITNPKTRRRVSVPGIITAHTTKKDARANSSSSTFYTCEAGDSNKYQWAGKLPGREREKYLFEFGNCSVKLLYKKTEYKFKIYLQLVTIEKAMNLDTS